MSRPFLFGGNTSSQTRSQYLVEFRAGKMTQNGSTVSPVKGRKGLVYLHQSPDDQLMHFCWKDRQSGAVEDDLIIFPDEAEFKRVTQCSTGRVFVLKFKPSSRRFFYWSQEPKEDKDEEWVNKVNEYINNPPAPGSRTGTGSGGLSPASALADLSSLPDGDLQGLLNNMSPQQLMSVLGGVGGMGSAASLASLLGAATNRSSTGTGSSSATASTISTPAVPQTPATTPAVVSAAGSESSLTTAGTGSGNSSAIQLSDLQHIISGLKGAESPKESDGLNVDLSSSLTLEALQPLITNKEFMDRVRENLPTGVEEQSTGSTTEQFASTVQSPQFQQALSTFSSALQSGQLGPLIAQFGLSQECVDAANSGDMEKFVKALQKQQQKDKTKLKDSKKDDNKEDDMALD